VRRYTIGIGGGREEEERGKRSGGREKLNGKERTEIKLKISDVHPRLSRFEAHRRPLPAARNLQVYEEGKENVIFDTRGVDLP